MSTTAEAPSDPNETDIDLDEDAYKPPPQAGEQDIQRVEIDVREDPFLVSTIVDKIRKGQIQTPEFQRKEVWDQTQRSEFIESLLLNYPVPPLFLNQLRTGEYMVVDGLQRSSTLFRYFNNEFELSNLNVLHSLNGSKFSELSPDIQSRLEDRKITCYVIKPSVPMTVVYEIFARINRGGTQLNYQEIRHALNQGQSTELLARLVEKPEFAHWIGSYLGPVRLGDQEAALRCIAFARADIEKEYRGDINEFLVSTMKRLNKAPAAEINQIESDFSRVWRTVRQILGDNAFRIPTPRGKGRINRAVMESVYRFFVSHSDDWLYPKADALRTNYATLLGRADYLDSVRFATGDLVRVKTRFKLAQELLGGGLAD